MLSREEVIKIAELAKIRLKENQVENLRAELSAILNFVGQLSKITGTTNSESISPPPASATRPDETILNLKSGQSATEQSKLKGGLIAVPNVFKKDEDNS